MSNAATDDVGLTIRFNRWRLLLVFLPLAVLIVISVVIGPEKWLTAELWVYCAFAALVVFLLVACVAMPYCYYLQLTPEGLTVQFIGSKRFYRWDEIHNFRVLSGGPSMTTQQIIFDLTADSPKRSTLVKAGALISGYDVSVLATYDLAAEDVVLLLTAWQARHTSAQP
jgi:hypothetical protein